MFVKEIVTGTTDWFPDICDVCDPEYCLPDAYNVCNPEMNEDGSCDPSEDDW